MFGTSHIPAPWVRRPNPIQMGLASMQAKDWLAKPDKESLTLRQHLIATQKETVFAAQSGALEACTEAAQLIKDHAPSQLLDKKIETHPLLSVGGAIMEDCLILQQQRDEAWFLTAGLLCFPAHWQLSEKMGQPLLGIHRPVPHYAEKLARPVDRLFDHMEPGKWARRKNWTLQIGDKRHAPKRLAGGDDPKSQPMLNPDAVGQAIFCREETQSFVKLPITGAVLFTIHTSLTPLDRWADDGPALASLLDELTALSPKMRDYRAVETYEPALIEWVKNQIVI